MDETMKKKVSELKRGDAAQVLFQPDMSKPATREWCNVHSMTPVGEPPFEYWAVAFSCIGGEIKEMVLRGGDFVEVEGRALLPNQQHADELESLVRAALALHANGAMSTRWIERAEAVLAKISPPAPTFDELLNALQLVTDDVTDPAHFKEARELVARARATGMLK